MPRVAQPYSAFGAPPAGKPHVRIPMDAPTLATRRAYGDNPARSGLITLAAQSVWVPLSGFARGSFTSAVFPKVQSSLVSPNGIKINYVAPMQKFSPAGHAQGTLMGSDTMTPKPATPLGPTGTGINPRQGLWKAPKLSLLGKRGTGGNYSIPAPLAAPQWPTSADWLRRKMGTSPAGQVYGWDGVYYGK